MSYSANCILPVAVTSMRGTKSQRGRLRCVEQTARRDGAGDFDAWNEQCDDTGDIDAWTKKSAPFAFSAHTLRATFYFFVVHYLRFEER